MFDILLIITLFLQASLVCLLILRLNINITHLPLFPFITDINGFFGIPPSSQPVYYAPKSTCHQSCLLETVIQCLLLFQSLLFWGSFTYYVITKVRGGRGSSKCLYLIMGEEGEGGDRMT